MGVAVTSPSLASLRPADHRVKPLIASQISLRTRWRHHSTQSHKCDLARRSFALAKAMFASDFSRLRKYAVFPYSLRRVPDSCQDAGGLEFRLVIADECTS